MRAGRDGSRSGTVAFSGLSCANKAPAEQTNKIAILLFIRFPSLARPMQADISIQSVKTQLRSSPPGASALQPVAAIHVSSVLSLCLDRRRSRRHIEIAIDLSIKSLEK